MSIRIIMLAVLLTFSSCRPAESPLVLVATYQELANQHQVEPLVAMYADEARLDFGPMGVIEGKDRIRAIHDYDRALNTVLRLENCHLEDLRVRCQTIERNDWLRTAGIARLIYSESVFRFDRAGRIEAVTATLAPASSDSLGRALSSFGAWAQAHQPEEYGMLFRGDGSFKYSYESGEQVLLLLKQWRASSQGVR